MMPDERAMMRRMAEAMELYGRGLDAPDFWPALTAYKEHEAAGRAEAPDADEARLRSVVAEVLLVHRDCAWRDKDGTLTVDLKCTAIHTLSEALIAYRERRYQEALTLHITRFTEWQHKRDEDSFVNMAQSVAALRALSERSDG